MTPDQEIRAAGIQAAAALCAPISGGLVPPLYDILFVADVFTAYIENGKTAAQAVYATSEAPKAETQESTPPVAVAAAPVAPAGPDPALSVASNDPAEAPANVIPISGRPDAPATPPNHVRDRIERLKRERAEKILAVALTAKVPEQKAKLVKLSAEAGLDEVVVSVDNRPTPLGAYLAAL